MTDLTGIKLAHARRLGEAENARFVAERPKSMALGERARRSMPRGVPVAWMDDLYDHPPVWVSHGDGPRFTDVDGHTYLDMYVADMSAFCGHAPKPVIEAVSHRMELGNQFLLPGEDAITVADHLAERFGLPKWQFTLSATQANTEVIRLARELTGRKVVLMFRRQVPRRGRRDARDPGGRGDGSREPRSAAGDRRPGPHRAVQRRRRAGGRARARRRGRVLAEPR
jgi:glutamate-1-semialdehyde 2,1-aminomutase